MELLLKAISPLASNEVTQMAKNKKSRGSVPNRGMKYTERERVRIDVYRRAEKETQIQYMTDMLVLTLNDPAIMGKDVFGKKRLLKVIEAWGKKYDEFHAILENNDETDYFQIKLDKHLQLIFGDQMEKFPQRYTWVKDQTY